MASFDKEDGRGGRGKEKEAPRTNLRREGGRGGRGWL